jgi:putative membrane protein
MTFKWSQKPFFLGFAYAAAVGFSYWYLLTYHEFNISINWQPIGVIGIATSFYLGFKNNESYARTWEARKIWGGIVNSSRAFASAVMAYLQGYENGQIQHELIYRHIAWLTALRYQLRLSKEWEHLEERVKGLNPSICEAYFEDLEKELVPLLEKDEFQSYKGKTNIAAHILRKQSLRLNEIFKTGYLDAYKQVDLQRFITEMFNDQGRNERIKNFPFPRQYASVAFWITLIFSLLTPFGLLNALNNGSSLFYIVLTVPFTALIIWVFFLMEMIGDYSENPFEGTYNDVPITSIAIAIEIDLREMLGEANIRPPHRAENGFLM